MLSSSQTLRCIALMLAMACFSSKLFAAEQAQVPASQVALTTASEQKKFTYILFHRDNSAAVDRQLNALKTGLASKADKATYITVNITSPEEKATVTKFNVSRYPMPLVLAVAPNGAITGVSASTVNSKFIEDALATPHMTECMKSMQSNKLVLLCVHGSEKGKTPEGVQKFIADPHYSKRVAVVSMQAADPQETRFLKDLQIAASASGETTVVFMAPPGVLVGKFPGNVTETELGQKLHAAGKCCDDPNCKHNHQH